MGASLQCGVCCTKEGLDSREESRSFLCKKPCGLDEVETDFIRCDPAGTVFDDTSRHLGELDRLGFHFAGTSNLAALRWAFVYGASSQARDSNGTTLLHVACRAGSPQVVKELILRSADLNAIDCAGWTALHVASCMGRQDVSLWLLQSGAKASCRNFKGQTAEDLCSNPHVKEVVVGFDEGRPRWGNQQGFPVRGTSVPEDDVGIRQTSSALHFEPFFVPRDPVLHEPRHRDELQHLGLELFNQSPGHGVAFLVALGVVRDFPVEINNFLVRVGGDPAKLGDYLSEEWPIAQTLRLEFLNSLPLLGTGVASALENALHEMAMPRDWLKVDRLTRGIAHFWWRQHEEELADRREGTSSGSGGVLADPSSKAASSSSGRELTGLELQRGLLGTDALHRLMFSTLMLHRWHAAGHTMTLNEWTQLNSGIEGAGNDVPLHLQIGIYKVVSEGRCTFDDHAHRKIPKPVAPSHQALAYVHYNGRPQTDGDPAQWPRATPYSLAAEGGVLSAGRMGLPSKDEDHFSGGGAARGRSRGSAQNAAVSQPFDAGGGSSAGCFDEEMYWLRLYQWLLLLAPNAPDSLPFAFVSLKRATLLRTDPEIRQIVIASRVDTEWAGMADDDWLELCLMLEDGRFQALEAPELVLRFTEDADFLRWVAFLREVCSDDAQRRQAALKSTNLTPLFDKRSKQRSKQPSDRRPADPPRLPHTPQKPKATEDDMDENGDAEQKETSI
eukprot:TRINITY_DN91212_c0_g1_i1.p1 TRINITY_DN91212_c0_g1~~TRINITY_DN91212_c0_g1_i1.p1  ORF type:complete len:728 (-),score=127.20 TRINITY_DN91212_c0_g1_i1:35-2218(-)